MVWSVSSLRSSSRKWISFSISSGIKRCARECAACCQSLIRCRRLWQAVLEGCIKAVSFYARCLKWTSRRMLERVRQQCVRAYRSPIATRCAPRRSETRSLRFELVEVRSMLTTNLYYWAPPPTGSDMKWFSSTYNNWSLNGLPTTWQNSGNGNVSVAVIAGATTQTTITVTQSIQAASISISGQYLLLFPDPVAYAISGGTVSIATSQSSLAIDADYSEPGGTSVTVESTIVGPGQLAAEGSGTLVLTNSNNSYTGGTDIQAGTVQLANGATLGAVGSAVQLESLGYLDLHGCPLTIERFQGVERSKTSAPQPRKVIGSA